MRVAFVSVAYAWTHKTTEGDSFVAISPAFKTADETKTHIRRMIADLTDTLSSVDHLFQDQSAS
jgi:hypothetical protein